MAVTDPGIEIVGLNEFRAAARRSASGFGRKISAALRAGGRPPLERVQDLAARTVSQGRGTGDLMKSYKIRVRGASAFLQSGVPYGAGAEWGVFGKWSGFAQRYPGPEPSGRGRFAWRAVLEQRDEIADVITEELRDLIGVEGWARP